MVVSPPEQQRGDFVSDAAFAVRAVAVPVRPVPFPVSAVAAHRSGEDVRLGLPARRPGRVGRRHDAQRQAAAVRYVTLLGVRRLHVQPLLVLEHGVHDHAERKRHFRLVMVVQLRLVQQTARAQHHGYVAGPADGRLKRGRRQNKCR